MAYCKGDGGTVRTMKTQVGYRQTLRRSQNLLTDNFETHHEATVFTPNTSVEHFPQSLAIATPSLRNELNVEVGIGETGITVNTNIHLHPYLASATTSMSIQWKYYNVTIRCCRLEGSEWERVTTCRTDHPLSPHVTGSSMLHHDRPDQ
ncbi:hypothetical protein OUZ56_010317 [Daphnia magna]|uniref:Uncharacterized protein n=1 Tax=Daphnia magna TaxID=35525 RepID=A0ABR0AIM7_9CRUS|nr:hypothetical protein OUZ56_010317 [Daphnia magna]